MIRRITTAFLLLLATQAAACAEARAPAADCQASTDCPATGNPCLEPFCDVAACTTIPVAAGTVITDQIAGDCQRIECDGAGKTVSFADDADRPVDATSCTIDACASGIPANTPVTEGTVCSEDGGAVCNASGVCVECLAAANCPGQDTACEKRVCQNQTCGLMFELAGTLAGAQKPGDCSDDVCDGAGGTTTVTNDQDVPNDGNACTIDVCSNGQPQNAPAPIEAPCNQNGGKVCDGNGQCVQCNAGSQCPSGVCIAGICQDPSCNDDLQNGTESDVDCGGVDCAPCIVGGTCALGSDCTSGVCQNLVCASPVVTTTVPAPGTMDVAVNADVSIVFSGAMNPASLVGQTGSGACTGSVQLSTDGFGTCLGFSSPAPIMSAGGTIAKFTPSPALSYGSTYAIRVTTAALGIDGSALGATYTSPAGFTTIVPQGASCGGSVVIGQIFGGGGNSGATYKNDYVELHNRGTSTVSLAGWSVQYASAAGTSWLSTNLTGSIAPGGYYLVQGASGGATGLGLPAPDASGMTNMSASAGKVALVNSTTVLSGGCPMSPSIVDFVGFGATATCFEGPMPAPGATNSTALLRGDAGCTETNDNQADFTTGTATPKNSQSTPYVCPCFASGTVNESGIASEIDFCNVQSPSSMMIAASATTPLILGRVLESGVTEAAGANATVIMQVGYGPANINPTTQSGWTFFPTTYNQQAGNADEYRGTFVAPATTGSYRYGFRASIDGSSWTYCDLNGAGSNAGATFEVTQLPVLVVQ